MSHARLKIRDRVVSILEAAQVADTVTKSRVYPLPADTVSAALVYTNNEVVNQDQTTLNYPRRLGRDLLLVIEVVARDSSRLNDRLDVLCAGVENAIGADNTLGGMAKDCVLNDTVITHSFDGDAPIGSARMQFRVQYRTSETDAGSVIS
jgi:hypothetical protein